MINDFKRLAAERQPQVVVFFPGFIGYAAGRWDKELFLPLAKDLKLVAGSGAGYDHVDVNYLTQIGAYYANSPVAVSEWVHVKRGKTINRVLNVSFKAYCNDYSISDIASDTSNYPSRDDVTQRSMEQGT